MLSHVFGGVGAGFDVDVFVGVDNVGVDVFVVARDGVC